MYGHRYHPFHESIITAIESVVDELRQKRILGHTRPPGELRGLKRRLYTLLEILETTTIPTEHQPWVLRELKRIGGNYESQRDPLPEIFLRIARRLQADIEEIRLAEEEFPELQRQAAQFAQASAIKLHTAEFDLELIRRFPRKICTTRCLVPISMSGKTLVAAMAAPDESWIASDAITVLKAQTGAKNVMVYLASPRAIQKAIQQLPLGHNL